MPPKATCLADIGDEHDQAVFMEMVELYFDGDLQAALDYRNKSIEEASAIMTERKDVTHDKKSNLP